MRSRLYFAIWIFNCLDLMGMKLIWHCDRRKEREKKKRIANVFMQIGIFIDAIIEMKFE